VDPDVQIAVKCNLCEGGPKCVEFCPKDALEYVRADKISIKKKRDTIEKFLDYQKTLASPSEEREV
jgi:Fe-S-cluster-containing hydrogenase component 2